MLKVKQNGIAKKENGSVKKEVKKELTKEVIGKTIIPIKTIKSSSKEQKTSVNIDDRIQKFEKLRGLATQRERLTETLNDLTKFNYNQDDSSSFFLRDSHNLEFKTTNTNLIKLVTTHLQSTLEQRKSEIEEQIVQFEL